MMGPTSKMIEAAAKVFASEAFGTNYADADRLTKEEFKKTASNILKAALAAMWRPIRSEDRVDGFKALGRGGGCDGVEQVIYNHRNGSWSTLGYTLEDGECSEGYSGPEMIIPISIFEDRK